MISKKFFPKLSVQLAGLDAVHRMLIALCIAIPAFFLLKLAGIKPVTGVMMSWDIFSSLMIIMIWIIFFNIPENKINVLAKREDESRAVIFSIVIISVLISMFGVVILIRNTSGNYVNLSIHEPVSLVSVGLSWVFLHSICAIHYGHMYYDDDDQVKGVCSKGLDFPNEGQPDYLDFAYFSFVIGMTFQVSDVTISTRSIRRFVLLHSVLSFLFNTIIVALTISVLTNSK